MEEAGDITTGDTDVIVAVVDTGVAFEDYDQYVPRNAHNGYYVNYLQAPDLAQTSFVAGYDFINDDAHPNDDQGHGTHVTGTIAQSTNNGIGAAGIAFDTTIMPVKVLDSNGSGSYTAIAEGIYFAADNGAQVINMSLGGGSESITLENALIYAYNEGVTIVCASGNDGFTNAISYPATYDAYCIAVGATRYDEAVSYYSNQGASLDITAPGGDTGIDQNGDGYGDGILQQTFGDNPTDFGYYFYQGTSMATPHVSGVAALLLAQDINRTPDHIREILQNTAKDSGPTGWNTGYSWGIVDAASALSYAAIPNSIPVAVISSPADGSEDIAISFDGSNSYDDDGDALTYRWNFGDGIIGSGVTTTHSYTSGDDYTVSLIVNDGKADSEATTTTLTIIEVNDPPQADAGIDQTAIVGQVVHFDAAGSYAIDGDIISYEWDFGDGASGSGETTDHIYTTGIFTVTLTVIDSGGLDASDESIVTVTATSETSLLSSDIVLDFATRKAGKNTFVKALATVTLVDDGGLVADVIVTGAWDDGGEPLSVVSDANGMAQFESIEIKNPASGTSFTFTIQETVKAGYDTTPEGVTSETVTY
ncbi:MAG: S8 family serine peptidase [Desulfuromonas sp.]|nr:S8 family serine peptidase [Desulfuromonas sp.]